MSMRRLRQMNAETARIKTEQAQQKVKERVLFQWLWRFMGMNPQQ